MLASMGKRGPEPENTERVVSYVPPEVRDKLNSAALARGTNRAAVIREAIERFLRAEERKRRGAWSMV